MAKAPKADSPAVAEAMLAAGLLATASDERSADAAPAVAALEAWIDRLPRAALVCDNVPDKLTTVGVRYRRVTATLRQQIDTLWLPVLAARFEAVIRAGQSGEGVPAGEPGALDLAAAIRTLIGAGHRLDGRLDARKALSRVAAALRAAGERWAAAVSAAVGQPDAPDLTALSLQCLRFEGLQLVADRLGDRRTATELARLSRRVARLGLTRATATIDAYLSSRDLLRMFDNAVVLGRIDDALTLAQRLIEALDAGEEEVTPSVLPADRVALEGFIAAITGLSAVLLPMLSRGLAVQPGNSVVVSSLLGQLGSLGRFSYLLPAVVGPAGDEGVLDRVIDLRRQLDAGIVRFVDGLLIRLAGACADPGGDHDRDFLIACAETAVTTAARIGDGRLVRRLTAALQTIAEKCPDE